MQGHKNSISAFALFKDGRRVITSCTKEGPLRIWDLQNGALLGGPFDEGHQKSGVLSVAISPDERRIASGGYKTVAIWVYSVCFSLDGKKLAGGFGDGTAIVWDIETGTVLAVMLLMCSAGN